MRSEEETEGIYEEGVHIVYEKENQRIRVTVNFGQISLNVMQARTLFKYLGSLTTEMEFEDD